MKKTLTLLLIFIGVFGYSQEFYYLHYPTTTTTVNVTNVNYTTTNTKVNLDFSNTRLNNVLLNEPLFVDLNFSSDLLSFSADVDLFLEKEQLSVKKDDEALKLRVVEPIRLEIKKPKDND